MNYFKNKKITVMGLGVLGRGVGDVEFLVRHGAELIVTDLKDETQLAPSLKRLEDFDNITFRLGEHRFEDFRGRDLILKAAGVPLDSPYIQEAREHGVAVEMSAALFARLSGAFIVGITGTRGKSTVTHMMFEVLQKAREEGRIRKNLFLGGNVRGKSTLALLDEVQEGDIAVLELDSWQLQGFGEAGISPDLAVFTTFQPDHLNYYKNDLSVYFADKAHVYLHQGDGDVFVTTSEILDKAEEYECATFPGMVKLAEDIDVPELLVPGAHNELNARLAKTALLSLGLDEAFVDANLAQFSGVPGRLERVADVGEVTYWNDTTATTPQAAVAAINALRDRQELVVIAGGSDKGIDLDDFAKALDKQARDLILLSGDGTDQLRELLRGTRHEGAPEYTSMKEAVHAAARSARAGDAVLLSPGLASFGLFSNEFDRGDQFTAAVASLQ